ncbi:hypothetical protein CTI12_AA121440 [Artemisia annua]|uniref:Uncharacterized protein n=1 Tax=Artemisia annua TaxID=35608 RepID=A0A2U1PRD0_ARTAN|nr:hypothetical protein CTI12_AA121440 [Artemisia annua]
MVKPDILKAFLFFFQLALPPLLFLQQLAFLSSLESLVFQFQVEPFFIIGVSFFAPVSVSTAGLLETGLIPRLKVGGEIDFILLAVFFVDFFCDSLIFSNFSFA